MHRLVRFCTPMILVLLSAGCQTVRCGAGTIAVDADGPGRYIDQDGRGRYVDQDGHKIDEVVCSAVTPATVCGVGTVMMSDPPDYLIDPDGGGWYVDQDGRGRYVDHDGGTIRADRACLLGELHQEIH